MGAKWPHWGEWAGKLGQIYPQSTHWRPSSHWRPTEEGEKGMISKEARFQIDPIALWLAIHGGDPPPDPLFHELLAAILIYRASSQLEDHAASSQIRSAATRVLEGVIDRLKSNPMPG